MAVDPPQVPILYGYDTSTFTQIVRLVLAEKGVEYRFEKVADWTGYRKSVDYRHINPFGLIPVLDHDGLRLCETLSIVNYIDAAFAGRALQPSRPAELGRMFQIMSIHDNHARTPWVSIIATQRNFAHYLGKVADETAIRNALPAATRAADVLESLISGRPRGKADLADLHLTPAARFFTDTPEGKEVFAQRPALNDWWRAMQSQNSVAALFRDVDAAAPG